MSYGIESDLQAALSNAEEASSDLKGIKSRGRHLRRSRRTVSLAAGFALGALGVYVVVFQPLDRPTPVQDAEDPRIAKHLRAEGSTHIPGMAPGPMTHKAGYLWIADQDGLDAAVWRVDSRTLERKRYSDVPANPVVDVVATHNHVWIVSNNGRAKGIHTRTGAILDRHLEGADFVLDADAYG